MIPYPINSESVRYVSKLYSVYLIINRLVSFYYIFTHFWYFLYFWYFLLPFATCFLLTLEIILESQTNLRVWTFEFQIVLFIFLIFGSFYVTLIHFRYLLYFLVHFAFLLPQHSNLLQLVNNFLFCWSVHIVELYKNFDPSF